MRALVAALPALLLLLASQGRAVADEPCELRLAPVQVSVGDTALDRPRSACVADSLSVGMRAYALLDIPNFYGGLNGSLHLDWSTVHVSGFEFGLGARLVDAHFVQTAVFTDTELTAGPLVLRAAHPSRRTWFGKETQLTHALAVEVPWTHGGSDTAIVAANPSVNATMMMSDTLYLHTRLSAQLWAALPSAGPDGRSALATSVDLGWGPWESVSFLLGTEVQGGWYGLGLDHLVGRGGMRVQLGDEHLIELSGGTVVAGEDRSTASAWLSYQWVAAPDAAEDKAANRLRDWAR